MNCGTELIMWQKNDALLNMMCITYITLSIRRAVHDMHDPQSVHAASMQWPVLAADVPAGGDVCHVMQWTVATVDNYVL